VSGAVGRPEPVRTAAVITVKALALVLRGTDGAVLVSEGENSSGGRYARPLGGSVEFGESAAEAVQRCSTSLA